MFVFKNQNKFLVAVITLALLATALPARAATLAERLKGKILLQVEHRGEAWYVLPETGERYYLKDGDSAYQLMRSKSLGITNVDLEKIPTVTDKGGDQKLVNRLKGYILLAVESHGEAWYVNPTTGIRYYLKDGQAAYEIMRNFGLGISTANLRLIPMNDEQIVFDQTFDKVAHVVLDKGTFTTGYYADKILPLASLTKLMTALVLLDLEIDWQKEVIVTDEDIFYPQKFVDPGDVTSEIELKAGDKIQLQDLWTAMLVASSNQSAALLAKHSGLSMKDFVLRLNQKAQSLGLKKTIFTEPSGLDPANIGTAKEMAIIAETAFARKKIAEVTMIKNFTAAVAQDDGANRNIAITNRNYSLMALGAEAAKTGFLNEAQRNVALKKDGKIIVVLHARSMTERNGIIKKLSQ